MRRTHLARILTLTALSLSCAEPRAEDPPEASHFRAAVLSHTDPARLAQSNIGAVINAYGTVPPNVSEWRKALHFGGNRVFDFLVPFSRAPGETHLAQPRILMNVKPDSVVAMNPLTTGRRDGQIPPTASGLYLGFIHRPNEPAPEVEFISFNRQRQAFDFGVIRNMGLGNPSVEFVDKESTCTSCHIARAPIFPNLPWANTTGNPTVFRAMVQRFAETDSLTYLWLEELVDSLMAALPEDRAMTLANNQYVRGASFFSSLLLPRSFNPAPPATMASFDLASVRVEPLFLRVHQYIDHLAKPEVREAVVETIVKLYFQQHAGGPGGLGRAALLQRFEPLDLQPCGILPAQMPVTLKNFNPVTGAVGTPDAHINIEPAAVTATLQYDVARRAGQAPVPLAASPANLQAYVEGPTIFDTSLVIDDAALSATGMTSADASFMLTPYRHELFQRTGSSTAAKQALTAALFNEPGANNPYTTPGALNSGPVKALYKRGRLPPREELMAAVLAGLDTFCQAHFQFTVNLTRSFYSHPGITPINFAQEPTPAGACGDVAKTSPCAGCHFEGAQKAPLFDAWDGGIWAAKIAAQPLAEGDGMLLVKSIQALSDETMPPPASPEAAALSDEERNNMIIFLCAQLATLKPLASIYQTKWDKLCKHSAESNEDGGDLCCADPTDPCEWSGDGICDLDCAWGDDPDCNDGTSSSSDAGGSTSLDEFTSGEASAGGDSDSGHESEGGGDTSSGDTSGGGDTSSGDTGAGDDSSSGGDISGGGNTSGGESEGGGDTSGGDTSGGETSGGNTSGGDTGDGDGSTSGDAGNTGDSAASDDGTDGDGSDGDDDTSSDDSTSDDGGDSGDTTSDGAGTGSDTDGDGDGDVCTEYCGQQQADCAQHCCETYGECDADAYQLCAEMCGWCSDFMCEIDDAGDTTGGYDTFDGDGTTTTVYDSTPGDDTTTGFTPPVPNPLPDHPFEPWMWGF